MEAKDICFKLMILEIISDIAVYEKKNILHINFLR